MSVEAGEWTVWLWAALLIRIMTDLALMSAPTPPIQMGLFPPWLFLPPFPIYLFLPHIRPELKMILLLRDAAPTICLYLGWMALSREEEEVDILLFGGKLAVAALILGIPVIQLAVNLTPPETFTPTELASGILVGILPAAWIVGFGTLLSGFYELGRSLDALSLKAGGALLLMGMVSPILGLLGSVLTVTGLIWATIR